MATYDKRKVNKNNRTYNMTQKRRFAHGKSIQREGCGCRGGKRTVRSR